MGTSVWDAPRELPTALDAGHERALRDHRAEPLEEAEAFVRVVVVRGGGGGDDDALAMAMARRRTTLTERRSAPGGSVPTFRAVHHDASNAGDGTTLTERRSAPGGSVPTFRAAQREG
jgi:hypothetical protein